MLEILERIASVEEQQLEHQRTQVLKGGMGLPKQGSGLPFTGAAGATLSVRDPERALRGGQRRAAMPPEGAQPARAANATAGLASASDRRGVWPTADSAFTNARSFVLARSSS